MSLPPALTRISQFVPGIGLAVVLAVTAKLVATGSVLVSPVLLAVLLGVAWRNAVGVPAWANQGLDLAVTTLLRIGVALVGFRLTLMGAAHVAETALPVVVGCIATAFVAGAVVVRYFGIAPRLGALLAAGTAVCGCTAVVALSPALRARSEETGFALVCVVVFGCVGMVVYPAIAATVFADAPMHAGIFLGTSIHDTSQVVGAALIHSQNVGDPEILAAASVTKFLRNLSMALLIPFFAWRFHTGPQDAPRRFLSAAALPPFVLCFVMFVALRTLGDAMLTDSLAWATLVSTSQAASDLLLVCGMAAVGLGVSFDQVRRIGARPLAAGFAIALSVAAVSLMLTLASLGWLSQG